MEHTEGGGTTSVAGAATNVRPRASHGIRDADAHAGRVFTVGHSSIPPYSESVLHCSVQTTGGRALPSSGMLDGLTLFAENTGLIVGRTLVDPSKWKVPVLVSNFSQETIVVTPFTELGMITQVTAIQSVAETLLQSQNTTKALPRHLQDLVEKTCRDLDPTQRHRLATVLSEYSDILELWSTRRNGKFQSWYQITAKRLLWWPHSYCYCWCSIATC